MIAGHFGFAAAAKSRVPELPLWALMLATVWLDVVFVPLLLAGLESAGPAEGPGPGYGHLVIHADYTHSVVGAAILALLFGLISAALWGRRAGIALGLVVMSHWVLDLVVHRADMPWLPANLGNLPRLGLGLWQYPWLTAAIELALVLAGAWLYLRSVPGGSQQRGRLVSWLILGGGVAVLLLDFTGLLG